LSRHILIATQLKQQSTPSMKSRHVQALGLIACIAAATVWAGDLTIEISGITPNRGKVYVAVYDVAEAFPIPGRQRVGQVVNPDDRHITVHFADMPPGQYAAVAFQDLNENAKLDKNFLGFPKEPYGFSNNARGTAGPPSFSQAAVTLNPDGATTVVLK
jgi:uncharacterized protein (DUF2141 family)